VFVAHAPLLFGTWLVYKRFGQAHGMPYPVYWVLAPVLTTMMLVALYRIAMHVFPRATTVLLGGRTMKESRLKDAQPAEVTSMPPASDDRVPDPASFATRTCR
jgi:hypothetical protein